MRRTLVLLGLVIPSIGCAMLSAWAGEPKVRSIADCFTRISSADPTIRSLYVEGCSLSAKTMKGMYYVAAYKAPDHFALALFRSPEAACPTIWIADGNSMTYDPIEPALNLGDGAFGRLRFDEEGGVVNGLVFGGGKPGEQANHELRLELKKLFADTIERDEIKRVSDQTFEVTRKEKDRLFMARVNPAAPQPIVRVASARSDSKDDVGYHIISKILINEPVDDRWFRIPAKEALAAIMPVKTRPSTIAGFKDPEQLGRVLGERLAMMSRASSAAEVLSGAAPESERRRVNDKPVDWVRVRSFDVEAAPRLARLAPRGLAAPGPAVPDPAVSSASFDPKPPPEPWKPRTRLGRLLFQGFRRDSN